MKKNDGAVKAIVGWLDEINPFDPTQASNTLVFHSTGVKSTPGYPVNANQAGKVRKAMQAKMDGKTVLKTLETKNKVKSLQASNRLTQTLKPPLERKADNKQSLRFELTPRPMSLFDNG